MFDRIFKLIGHCLKYYEIYIIKKHVGKFSDVKNTIIFIIKYVSNYVTTMYLHEGEEYLLLSNP